MQIPLYSYNHKTGMSRDEKVGGVGLERGALNLKQAVWNSIVTKENWKRQQNQLHASEAFLLQVYVVV